jgi:hypothetical protein
MRRTTARMGAWSAAFVLAACGGSGGGGSSSVEGDFFAVGYEADADPSATARATWGASAESNGSTLTMALFQNVDGTISGPTVRELDVSVDDDGGVVLRDTASGEAILGGRVGEGGDLVVAASVRTGDLPRVLTLVRDAEGAETADLSGDHHFGLFTFDGGQGRGTSGVVTFDGLGGALFPAGASTNTDGSVAVSGIGSPASYTVSPSGVVDLDLSSGLAFQGGLDPTGELVVLGGTATPSEFPGWMILVRESVGASDAAFSGTYATVAIALDPGAPFLLSFVGDVVADGEGTAEIRGSAINVDGVLASNISPSEATYAVGADGTLTFATGDEVLRGGISPSGRYAVLGGGISDGSFPQLRLLVRR